jgi:type II restriction/modification system DNA methylase subunit YeeA
MANMNLAKLKTYAPEARRDFIQAMTDRASFYGLTAEKIEPIDVRGDVAVIAGRDHPRAIAEKRKKLEARVGCVGFKQTMEAMAYTWFNRLVAIRFMELHGYLDHGYRVLSHPDGKMTPEILERAEHVELPGLSKDRAIDLKLEGNKESELYRLLLTAQCNALHKAMPFLFERIDDETELLLPDNLLHSDSLVRKLIDGIDEDDWKEVEVIGWLYQFYISEKKSEVFAGLKKNTKITPENIPAATQLFTPHWIVRFLVENSLGRLWMLNRPNSNLRERMAYYIASEQPKEDFLRISSPEEIKVCDLACGSGHMLTYAFDLLHAIYQEEGYEASDIPSLILTHNLHGIEIDERAGALAAFALTMKATERRKRFLRTGLQPNICIVKPVKFEANELANYMDLIGRDLFSAPLRETLMQFGEADNLGSLIRPVVTDVVGVRQIIETKDIGGNLFLHDVNERVLAVLRMVEFLSPKYQVVVANPPYMNATGMNAFMKSWSERNYPDSSSDAFSMFIERACALNVSGGLVAMVTMQNWLFLSSFEALRDKLLEQFTLRCLCQIGYNSFPEMNSKVAQAAAFVIENTPSAGRGIFFNLNDAPQSADKGRVYLEKLKSRDFFSPNPADFRGIPGSPIAYWATDKIYAAFESSELLSQHAAVGKGLDTGDNDRFMRLWHEVAKETDKWVPCQKGGPFRKWYGNNDFLLNWEDDGKALKEFPKSNLRNAHNYFRAGISWTRVSSAPPAFRRFDEGQLFESTGPCVFANDLPDDAVLGLLNSNFARVVLGMLAPSLDFQSGHVSKIPVPAGIKCFDTSAASKCVGYSRSDWNEYETSWDFTMLPLLANEHRSETLQSTYGNLRGHWGVVTKAMQQLEEENNRIFIDAYDLQDELESKVPLEEITLTCNPAYRYDGKKSGAELDALLVADTMREFVSYAVGCMFGRYSLDAPSLILANQGDGMKDYLSKVPNPTFEVVANNVIPVLDGDWFADDITASFARFLRITFGEKGFQENLAFIETSLGKDIRKYFTREFFNDHVKRYKKRPIYWLFSSGKHRAFQCLIYLHRYNEGTLARIRTEHVIPLQGQITSRIDTIEGEKVKASSTSHLKKLQKEQEELKKQRTELLSFDERLKHFADQKISLDLDDGVKFNYGKFGDLLAEAKAITGGKDDE